MKWLGLAPALLVGMGVSSFARSSNYEPPKVGTKYHFYSSFSGEGVSEVVSSDADRYGIRTSLGGPPSSQGVRLLGIWFLSELSQEGISFWEAGKARKIFPLKVGNKANFDTYGTTNGGNWTRRHNWEVVSEHLTDVGSGAERIFVIKLKVEAPGFFKFEGACDYSTRLAVCLRLTGDQFILRAPHLTGRLEAVQRKVVVDKLETIIPSPLPIVGSAEPIAPPSQTPPPKPPATPSTIAQRLQQAKELLDKKLISQQQYDEFVSRALKDL